MTSPFPTHQPLAGARTTRRAFIGGSVALAAGSAGLLAGCTDEPAPGPLPIAQRVALPTHVPFTGVLPDLPGENGSADAFVSYPAKPAVSAPEIPGDGSPVTAMCALYMPARPKISDNPSWQNLNANLGSEFQLEQVPAADYVARFSTMVAGGDLPAMMEFGNVARLPELVKAKFIDLTEHLSGDAITKYPNLANLPPECWQAGVFNNAIYGIPTHRGMWQSPLLMARTEVTDAKGVAVDQIGSFDDFFRVCGELTDSRKSTWALTSVPSDYLSGMLGIPNGWRFEQDALISAYEVPEQEEVLSAGIKLWKAGVVHPDAFALSGFQPQQIVYSGQAALFSGVYPAWIQYEREYVGSEPFTVKGLPLPGFTGGKGTFRLGKPAFSVAGISQGNEARVETILKIWNYLCAPFGSEEHLTVIFGKEGVDYNLEGTDMVQTSEGVQDVLSLVSLVCAPRVGYFPNDPEVVRAWHGHMKQMASSNPTPNPALYRYSATESSKGTELNSRMTSAFNDILQGRKPVSTWAATVADWKAAGGDRIRGELEEALAAER